MKTHEIRVAICGCTKKWHGQFSGKAFILDGVRYRVQEIGLSNSESHTAEIKLNRCHFFLDQNTYNTGDPSFELDRNDLIPSPSGTSEKLEFKIRSAARYRTYNKSEVPAAASGVIKRMKGWMEELSIRKRKQWLRRMALPPS